MDSLTMYIDLKDMPVAKRDPLNGIGYILGYGEHSKSDINHSEDAKALAMCIIQEIINNGVENSTFLSAVSDGIKSGWNKEIRKVDVLLLLHAIDKMLHEDDYSIETDEEISRYFLNSSKKVSVASFEEEVTRILDSLVNFYEGTILLRRYMRFAGTKKSDDGTADKEDLSSSNDSDYYDNMSLTDLHIRKKMQDKLQEDWISSQNEITNSLKAIQPDIATILETIMNFTKTTDEKFVLRLVDLLLDLYNLLYDGYVFHKERAYTSNNRDYQNAVENYVAYMDTIADIMASFGVEEIYSNPGDEFNPHLHEVCNNPNFGRKTAVIKEHLKSGFEYKENVIQKELIVLE